MPLPPVIFEDDTLVAFDKPAGLPVAPGPGGDPAKAGKGKDNLLGLARAKYGAELATVHRLDTETGGVLLCAKTKPALDFLSGQFQAKTAESRFHALAVVLPPDRLRVALAPVRDAAGALPAAFAVGLALAEDEHQAGRMHIFTKRGGRPATTEFRMLERFGGGGGGGAGYAWIECRPLTARRHQVRAHLAAAGAPILNDGIYGDPIDELRLSAFKRGYKGRGDERPLISRLALHASALTVRHPATRLPLTLLAPLPAEFEIALKYLRKFASRADR